MFGSKWVSLTLTHLIFQLIQSRHEGVPEYSMESHIDGVFTMNALVQGTVVGQGSARTKKGAEQIAAQQALETL